MSASHELYQEMILDHSRRPRHYGQPATHTHMAEGDNPLCGDSYRVYLTVGEDGKIDNAAFEGSGCAISKASASLMTDAIIGLGVDEMQDLFEEFHTLVLGSSPGLEASMGKLASFSGIWKYPSRVKCAILCWHAVRSALADGNAVSTEVR